MSHRLDIPFVLRQRTLLPPSVAPAPHQRYDPEWQLWVSTVTGVPVVSEQVRRRQETRLRASDLGETFLTKTSEGHDQSERIRASDFGETTITRTSEATDQHERLASDFGETLITATGEGTDQAERLRASQFGETLITETREGIDQSETIA